MPEGKLPLKHRLLNLRLRIRWFWRGILCFFGKFQKPREIVWEKGYGGTYPACPRCHELIYYENRCCFCGQPFKNGAKTIGSVIDHAGDS